jgi:hypothetical protein
MWRLEPKPGIVVSLKRNPGQRTHAECANRGYRNLRGATVAAPAPIVVGGPHRLAASLTGRRLRVLADGKPAWEGDVDADALALRGPVGVRSDNGRFDFALHAAGRVAAAAPGCVAADEE